MTVPQTVNWTDYQKELAAVSDPNGDAVLNYRVHRFPKAMNVGDRLYVVHKGRVRGWMTITGMEHDRAAFRCETTGTMWRAGNYIQRKGVFHAVPGRPKKGFRGVSSFAPYDFEGGA